jgi:hypothetical protein|uniref:hypothetical protein n=1 Tax=Nonomuraea sp. CA-252377 TaxID=3240003 RepID=UPI003F4949F7
MIRRSDRRTTHHARYARQAVQALAPHFGDLTDPTTSATVERSITAYRIKPGTGHRIRMACTWMPPRIPDAVQEQRDLEHERALTALVQEQAS